MCGFLWQAVVSPCTWPPSVLQISSPASFLIYIFCPSGKATPLYRAYDLQEWWMQSLIHSSMLTLKKTHIPATVANKHLRLGLKMFLYVCPRPWQEAGWGRNPNPIMWTDCKRHETTDQNDESRFLLHKVCGGVCVSVTQVGQIWKFREITGSPDWSLLIMRAIQKDSSKVPSQWYLGVQL